MFADVSGEVSVGFTNIIGTTTLKNRYRTHRLAIRAISVFRVKFNVEFTSQVVNFPCYYDILFVSFKILRTLTTSLRLVVQMWLNRLMTQRKTLPVSKIAQRKKRKTNVEKSLEVVFDKFYQFSNDEFLRYITVTLIHITQSSHGSWNTCQESHGTLQYHFSRPRKTCNLNWKTTNSDFSENNKARNTLNE